MKKAIGKTFLVIFCVAIIVFLLLPFLETTAPQQPGTAMTKATPQIFTSNPLTELVNRIARFFRSSSRQQPRQEAPQTLTAQQAQEQFGAPQGEEVLADARGAVQNYISTEETPSSGRTGGGFGGASFQDEEGDWVLIRQKTPDLSAPGMHEITTKDNAYDSFIRQERAARFTPVARARQTKQVPDSKLARFFNPIKRFFGLESAEKSLPNPNIWQDQQAAMLASSDGIGKSRNESGSSFAGPGTPNMPGFSGELGQGEAASRTPSLLNLIDPEAALNEVADFLADSKYPNPQNDREQQEKNDYRKQRFEAARQYVNGRLQERMNRLAAGQEPEDEMKNMLEYLCTNKAPRPVKSGSCSMDETDPTASKQEIEAAKRQNAETFFRKTQKTLPPAPVTPIIGKATGLNIEVDPEIDSESFIKTMEIYQFMMQDKECQKNSCYWVANSHQNNTELSDSVEAAGVTFKGDPLDKYKEIEQKFTEYKLAQLPQNATEEEKRAVLSQAADFPPPYILYTTDNLKTLQAKNREALLKRDMQGGAALYALSAPIGKQLSEDLDSSIFFYGKDDGLINADTNPTFVERSAALTNDLADQIQFIQQVTQELKRNAAREVVEGNARATAQQVRKQAKKDRAAFDKSNSLGHAERGQ